MEDEEEIGLELEEDDDDDEEEEEEEVEEALVLAEPVAPVEIISMVVPEYVVDDWETALNDFFEEFHSITPVSSSL